MSSTIMCQHIHAIQLAFSILLSVVAHTCCCHNQQSSNTPSASHLSQTDQFCILENDVSAIISQTEVCSLHITLRSSTSISISVIRINFQYIYVNQRLYLSTYLKSCWWDRNTVLLATCDEVIYRY